MIKKDILKLIEHSKRVINNSNQLSLIKDKILERNYWFPNIEELQEEFNILEKELNETLDKTIKSEQYIQNNCHNHEIRLEHYGLFCSDYKCIFCGKNIRGDNCVNWEYSTNRNKYCVSLVAKYQEDDDYGYIKKGYTNEEVYEIITNILKDKLDDEEIDLIQEFKKLNLPNCKINEDKKVNENYILIISGSNKQYIDEESYIHKIGLNIGIDFLKYFKDLLNTKVELIDNSEILVQEKEIKENQYLKLTKYDTLAELKEIISKQKEIPFKIIIDISELYEYKIENNIISKESYELNLANIFPNTQIIKITNLTKNSLKELSQYLKTNTYVYQQNKYYYQENDEIKSSNLENTCVKIKKLLKSV